MPYDFLLGGARAGKSTLAERLAAKSRLPVTVVATATAADEEMAERIARHRANRPPAWSTVEEPLELLQAILGADIHGYLIVDCLTLWLMNIFDLPDEDVAHAAEEAAAALKGRPGPGAVVSNEVGMGIVPAEAFTRRYRDLLGRINTIFAAHADRSYLVVAGKALLLEEPPLV